jgi:predicted RNA-binding Zn ribbon-like protein
VTALRLSPALAAWAKCAAALVNTRPRATDPAEKLTGVGELERLLAGCPEPPPAPPAQADVAALRALRPALLAAFQAPSLEALATALNPLLAGDWRLQPAERGWVLGPAGEPSLAAWFGARAARGLAELVLAYGLDRLHVCRADDCLCAVVDVSRNATRRYCSRTCANRVNARRHRGRTSTAAR